MCKSKTFLTDILEIPGYNIILPKSWQIHGQARVLVIARDELQVKIKDIGMHNSDLPTITCEISLGREKKTLVNYFYRKQDCFALVFSFWKFVWVGGLMGGKTTLVLSFG